MNNLLVVGLVVILFGLYSPINALEIEIDCGGVVGVFCGDCKTLAVCSGGATATFIDCPKYCNNGQCSETMDTTDSTCNEIEIEETENLQASCTGEGYFQNPKNCSEYFYCYDPALNKAPVQYKCKISEMFDSYNFKCVTKAYLKDCVTLKCTQVNTLIAYTPNPSYYGYCKTLDDILMFKCPTGKTFKISIMGCT